MMMNTALVLILATAAVSVPGPAPLHVQVEVRSNPYVTLLQIALSAAVILTSVSTFVLGYRKRIQERRATWYQRLVLDHSVPKVFDFFSEWGPKLSQRAEECQRNSPGRKTLSKSITGTIASMSEDLIAVQNLVMERTIVFDEKLTDNISERFERVQDDVSEWFEAAVVKKRGTVEELQRTFTQAERELIRLLYESEFRNF